MFPYSLEMVDMSPMKQSYLLKRELPMVTGVLDQIQY
jgi:hypothetical protein